MKIRSATINDAQAIHELHTKAVTTTCKDFYTNDQINAWLKGRSAEGYHKGIINKEMYVAEDNGKITGFGHATPGIIEACYVDPEFHNKGIGKLLIEHGMKIALKNHSKIIVESTINAESFYKKYGFNKIKKDAIVRNNVKIPTVIMEYKLVKE